MFLVSLLTSRSAAVSQQSGLVLAYPRQLLSHHHVYHPLAADATVQDDLSRMFFHYFSHKGGLIKSGHLAEPGFHFFSSIRRYDGKEYTFIGHIERIKAQQFAAASHFFQHGDMPIRKVNSQTAVSGGFVQAGGHSSPGRVAQKLDLVAKFIK